jgi:hypothetical protein
MVSALGASSAFAVTDRAGRFEMRTLSPGPYLVRAHLSGYVAPHGQIVDVRPSARTSSSIALRHAAGTNDSSHTLPVLAAGLGGTADPAGAPPGEAGTTGTTGSAQPNDDHGETAWRLRHARRGVLKDSTAIDAILADGAQPPQNTFGQPGIFGKAVESPARLASSLFSGTPFSGQVNLFTTSSFDSPQQLFSADSFARSVAYVSVGAPVGSNADWNVRGALTQGDIASWVVAAEYVTRAPARHRYDIGMTYAAERFDAGNLALMYNLTDGSRNAGTVYAYDAFTLTPAVTISYGSRFARYDYLANRGLMSPRVAVTLVPAEHLRLNTMVSSQAVAPGAEEFLPPTDTAILLPPQRTFSPLDPAAPLNAERTTHAEVSLERDVAGSSTIQLRAFHQHVDDQLVTMFGVDVPGSPAAQMGHYLVANTGDVDATGWVAGFRTAFAERVHGSIEYSQTTAHWQPTDLGYVLLLAPAAAQLESQRIHDVTTALETEVPQTSTKVMVLYRISNGFARPVAGGTLPGSGPSIDSRFDIQVRQALPFMDFTTARWEMLIAVRNFFRDPANDQSVYDELLVVRPPKRIVGGLTLHF